MQEKAYSWVVVKTFNRHEMEVSEFLTKRGVQNFVPMQYAERFEGYGQKPRKVLVPVLHNYVFVQKTMLVSELKALLSECRYPLFLMMGKDSDKPSEIPNREMFEFRMLCDPDFDHQTTIVAEQEEAKPGKEVEIIHGPFTGVRGRLLRKQKEYWFVKTVAGVSVTMRITRWFCRPV